MSEQGKQAGPNAPRQTAEGVTVAAPPAERPKSYAGEKCVVACKLPNGAHLRLFREEEISVPVMGGGTKTVKQFFPIEDEDVILKGNAVPFGREAPGLESGGYALTHDVDRAFMEKWMQQNSRHPWVVNKLIIIESTRERAMDHTSELAKVRSGLEPIAQDGDPRTKNLGRPGVSSPGADRDNMSGWAGRGQAA